ncbi:hypothetical protein LOTGIDRAFT_155919 [Lottia gigantea]|uniref:Uncharacterized protein n=1 Tax=Lottia gigantea TaxID=225164 RepID=V4B3F4_LOTGI|nr:hypothetical protein LOTGIDRAFT_155919 [Lottia gigantea]ESO82879.1 hypothetical protein LOTGIDRAFT_155919 [Lottia gigantea]
MSKSEPSSLKSIATIICSEAILNLYDDGKGDSRNYLIQTLLSDDYGDIALSILERIINFYPSFLTDELLFTLIPELCKKLRLGKCQQITGCNLLKVVQKCQLLEIFDIGGCEQLMLPALFSVLGGLLLNLTTVDISDCRTITDEIVQDLLKSSRSLNHLNVSNSDSLTDDAFLLDLESQDMNLIISQKECGFKETGVNIKTINISACENLTSLSVAYICALSGPNLHSINMSYTKISSIALLYLSGYSLSLVVNLLLTTQQLYSPECGVMSELLVKLKHKCLGQRNCFSNEGFCDCLQKVQQKVMENDSIDDILDKNSTDDQCSSSCIKALSQSDNIDCENIRSIDELNQESSTVEIDCELWLQYYVPYLKSINYSVIRTNISPIVFPVFFKSVKLFHLTISIQCLQGEIADIFISTQTDLMELCLTPEVELISDSVIKLAQLPLQLSKIDFTSLFMLSDVSIIPLISENLAIVKLSECGITDLTLKLLAKKSSLKWLDLSWCEEITETGISCFTKSCGLLEYLNLRHCDVNNQILYNIAENCQLIKDLNLSCIEGLLDEAVIEIADNLPFLEEIDISWNSEITDKSIVALFTCSKNLRVGTFSGNKRITSEPMYLLVTDLKNWMQSQHSKKFLRRQKKQLHDQEYFDYRSDDEEDIENYLPRRSAIYGCNLKKINLEYVDDMSDELLAWIAAFTFSSLEIIDYYSEKIKPAKFRVENHRLLMP